MGCLTRVRVPSLPLQETRQTRRVFVSGQIRAFTISAMAYDERLAARIRELIETEPGLTEKKMFGGLAFLIGGNMAVAASGEGGIMVRVDPAESDALVDKTKAQLVVMRDKPMRGWLRVDPEHLRAKRELAKWVELGTAYAHSLPAKR
jgi:TfoX/Sxy family transcriptional regulator of competence genes